METRTVERRPSLERAAEGTPAIATGYAAVFYRATDPGSEYSVGNVHERIAPGAFDRALKEEQDVVAKYNHDSNNVLGRISNGTLRLEVDTVGLKYSIDLPDTTVGRDLAFSLDRGDVKGSSFAFNTVPGGVSREYREGEMIVTLTDLDIGDVGPVANPAYGSSSAHLRDSASFKQYAQEAEYVERDRRQRRARGLDVSDHIDQD